MDEQPPQAAKTALVTGCLGQDGSYLIELLLAKGYMVHGIAKVRTSDPEQLQSWANQVGHVLYSTPDQGNMQPRLQLHFGDILESFFLMKVLSLARWDEIYHLAAQTHVERSFSIPLHTSDVNALGTLRLLQAILAQGIERQVRFYNACSSEVFGAATDNPQTETTSFHPLSPYATSKVYSYWITANFRASYKLHAVNGIMFNHESPRRGVTFVTRKISLGVALIVHKEVQSIELGNLNSSRDWGHAKEYVQAMYLMMQLPKPDDIVVATGETHTVREFAEEAFRVANIPIFWEGTGAEEVGKQLGTGEVRVKVNPSLFRANDVPLLRGSPTRAERILNWKPTCTFKALVRNMVEEDLKRVRRMRPKQGFGWPSFKL